MAARGISLGSLTLLLALTASTAAAQSLADQARAAQEKQGQQGQKPAKVYTTDDIGGAKAREGQAWVPDTYALTQVNATINPHLTTTVHVYRDGPKKLIQISLPSGKDNPKGSDKRRLYDTEAHKVYTWDMIDPAHPCTVADYLSADLPSEADPGAPDPVPGAAAFNADLASQNPKSLGNDTVNGIATHAVEVSDPKSGDKERYWMENQHNAIVRWVVIDKDGLARARVEVKEISFDKPPASLLTPPPSCVGPSAPGGQK
jgi:hypothetical protein